MNKPSEFIFSEHIQFTKDSARDFHNLDGSVKGRAAKAIKKTASNPKPNFEGGYGKPLSGNLKGFLKVKVKSAGIRVVYKKVRDGDKMYIIIISVREGNEVYQEAEKRIDRCNTSSSYQGN